MRLRVKSGLPLWVPVTPAGSPLVHIAAATEDQAWENLMLDAVRMPYDDLQAFKERGYTVEYWEDNALGRALL
jgi:hypothetical protein